MSSVGDTIYIKFTTLAFATGVPTTLAGSPVLSAYEDASTTEITSGVSVTVDLDGVTGLNLATIAATAGNGFETGKQYAIVITTGTVNAVSVVGVVVGQFTLRSRNAYMGPRGPGVYLNDAAGNTDTADGVDGTVDNPVSTIAAAKTLADSMSLDRIYLVNDSIITLAATMENYEFVGIGDLGGNFVVLGSQDVDGAYFENCVVTGAQGGTGRFMAHRAGLTAITSLEVMAWECAILGNLTIRQDSFFDKCWSAVAGNATPTLDINSVANINISWRHYSGGLQIDNAVATTVISYETDGQLIVDSTCNSLTVTVRGNLTITDNGTNTNITKDAAISVTNLQKTAMTESYSTDGATVTLTQALYEIKQALTEFAITGTTITVKKLDGETKAMTYTLDDGTNPTSRTRAT